MLRLLTIMMVSCLWAGYLYAAEAQDTMLEDLDMMEKAFSDDILPESGPVRQSEEAVIDIPAEVWIEEGGSEIIETPSQPVIDEPSPVVEEQDFPVQIRPVLPHKKAENPLATTHSTAKQPDVVSLSIDREQGKMVSLTTVYGTKFDVYALGPENAKVAVLVIHDRWGLNERVKKWAQRYAHRGYLTIAADLYGGRLVKDTKSARKIMRSLDAEGVDAKFAGIIDFLSQSGRRIVVAGWGKGANHALDISINYPDKVSATVTYYGDPGDEDQGKLRAIKTPVLGVYTRLDIVGPSGTAFEYGIAEEAWQVTTDFLEKKFE